MIVTEVVDMDDGWSVVASVVGAAGSPTPRVALEILRASLATERRGSAVRAVRRLLARRLLEPGSREYRDLVIHSEEVSRLSWSMARVLGLDDELVEDAAIAGLLHDVGMRELDYDRVYRMASPGPAEQKMYQRHPALGAELVAGTGLDRIAEAIHSHHERWDGTGYPGRLSGEGIPLLSRLVHVAETWDVLSSASSYRASTGRDQAAGAIRRGAGQQFDPRMVAALLKVIG
jgi:putative nucleotidyltransferase with HDIG domain